LNETIKRFKSGKVTETNGINIEFIKYDGNLLKFYLLHLSIIAGNKKPSLKKWNIIEVKWIFKKGDWSNCNNYQRRSLFILNIAYLTSVIKYIFE